MKPQGNRKAGRRKSFFEGWYFKHQNEEETIAFIPGVQTDEEGNSSAFIQVITENAAFSTKYPLKEFKAYKDELWIGVGRNEFSDKGVIIDLKGEKYSCAGELVYGPLTPLGHNCMGPFRFIPFLECSHEVISMGHGVAGELHFRDNEHGGRIITFGKGSTGYIEKDKGRSFPHRYAWVQCNRFQDGDLQVMASAATIPILGKVIIGCTCAINYQDQCFPLATFLGAKVTCMSEKRLEIVQAKRSLIVEAIDDNSKPLFAPERGRMSRIIQECPSCKARFRFYDQGRILFDYSSDQASFEYSEFNSK
ncbi:MAG TPA: tocopherol cyclase family protein [Bacillota bacterium]|jgi:hypothetical protein|nr:tocopherol cyclase family protein [Bacillota bacterium]